jgi:hypothetical protein
LEFKHPSNLFGRLIALRAMGSAPAGLLIEALLMPLNTVPAGKMRTIVGAERLDYMSGFAIATLAAMKLEVFYSH